MLSTSQATFVIIGGEPRPTGKRRQTNLAGRRGLSTKIKFRLAIRPVPAANGMESDECEFSGDGKGAFLSPAYRDVGSLPEKRTNV
jgi:hypothetical protein